MANSDSVRAYMVSHALNLFPSLVRAELLSDSKFLEVLGLTVDVTISFGENDVAFSRTALFKAIRCAFDNIEEESVSIHQDGVDGISSAGMG